MARRTKEFDRARLNIDEFSPFAPEHHVAMMSSDPRYKANRELVKGLMSPGMLSTEFAPVIYEKASHLIDLWKTKMDAAKGRPFAALDDLREVSWELTLTLVFGFDEERKILQPHRDHLLSKGSSVAWTDSADTASFARPQLATEVQALAVMVTFVHFASIRVAKHLQIWILKRTKWRKYFQTKEKLLSKEINNSVERLQSAGSSDISRCKTVIDHLLEREIVMAEKTNSSPDFNRQRIRDEAFGFFVAGSDTVSTSMGWTVKFLADNQIVQAKLRRQLQISYFDTEILGHHIPKGTTVFLMVGGASITEPAMRIANEARSPSSQAHSQRMPSWDDDEVADFRPERWLKTNGEKTGTDAGEFDNVEYDCNAGPMLSFGAGSRGCFGKRLAYLEMRIMITLLVWNFTFEKCALDLSSYVERDEFSTIPTRCYVKLKQAE
ncbi:hypothetical protein E4U09_005770 [Claviceps aff. purpurea]|uniref:Cytochrome P450 n=1 Tax=Claviceps aff. purpurea TaxID=1967640 RepID=A0A9P7QR61_9HYPO|nr:hypothetical protein E4U09_005770 [Claviceps aff. purpurea]